MDDQNFNPYAPPSINMVDVFQKALGSGEYRIEKKTLIIREPCRLPRVCLWTGELSDLIDCEFQVRVMPRWWGFVMPILIFGQQIVVVPLMPFLMTRLNSPASGVSPVIIGLVIGIIPGFLIFLTLAVARTAGRQVRVHGWYSRRSFHERQGTSRRIVLGVAIAVTATLGSIGYLTGIPWVFMIAVLLPMIVGLIIGLRTRTPSPRVFGSLTKDEEIVISGFRPEFLRALQKLKTMSSPGVDHEI